MDPTPPTGEPMSPRRTVSYVIAAAAIATAVACGGKSKSSSSSAGVTITTASSSRPSTHPAPSGGSKTAPDSDIQALGAALAKVKSFKATIKSEGGALSQDGMIEVSVPDKFHIVSGQ